jgi:hypothetical protein
MRTKLTKIHCSFAHDTSRGTPGFAVPQTSSSSAIFWSFATSEWDPYRRAKLIAVSLKHLQARCANQPVQNSLALENGANFAETIRIIRCKMSGLHVAPETKTVRRVGTGHLCIYTAVACRAGAIDFDTYDSGYNWRTSLPTSRRRVIIPGIDDGDTATLVSPSRSG